MYFVVDVGGEANKDRRRPEQRERVRIKRRKVKMMQNDDKQLYHPRYEPYLMVERMDGWMDGWILKGNQNSEIEGERTDGW